MDNSADVEHRFHGPHLPTTARQQLPETLKEIESAITEFLGAADDLIQDFSRPGAKRVWVSSRMAWSLMFPYRRPMLQTSRPLLEEFRTMVRRLREALETGTPVEGEFFEYLQKDLSRRESLLDALLSENSETRIRDLLAAERRAVESS